jgi:hypothetical protein
MLNSHEPDKCCGKTLGKALLSGALDTAVSWTCPKCGLEWRPRFRGFDQLPDGMLHWEPRVYMERVVPVR